MDLLQFLSNSLCTDKIEIIEFSLTSPHRYKTYKIPKRNSDKKRTIAQPSKELKFFQRLIISYIEEKLPVHDSAFAYRKKLGIKDNALVHVNSNYLLKMDFENFFSSITPELFFSSMGKIGLVCSDMDLVLLKNFLFWRETRWGALKLSIGAPSSPLISNFIMFFFDTKIKKICDEKNINYTRYADDLTFSTSEKNRLFDIPNLVAQTLINTTSASIRVNSNKTVFSSKGHNRHVTGITLTNNNVISIGRNNKRLISSMIHRFEHNLLDSESIYKLHGHFSFACHIEPEFYSRMCKKYGKDVIDRIKKYKPDI